MADQAPSVTPPKKAKMTNTYSITEKAQPGALFGIGNPLLDISAVVDKAWLDKYELEANAQILAEAKHATLYDKLLKFDGRELLPGGAALNTIRAAQWVIQEQENSQGATAYTGSVNGDEGDKYLEHLEKAVKEAGVNAVYHRHGGDQPTGTCAVLVTGDKGDRSLVANLAAANKWPKDAINESHISKALADAQYVYASGFFLTTDGGPDTVAHISKVCNQQDSKKIMAMNLSAPFLSMFFKDQLHAAIDGCDIVFGNETEFETYGAHCIESISEDDVKKAAADGTSQDLRQKIIEAIAARPATHASQRPRLVVCTQGCDATLAYSTAGGFQKFPVEALEKSAIVDTNGAGDAFVAGFLAGLMYGRDLAECAKVGNFCATEIIKQTGCNFPKEADFPKFGQ